MVIMKGSVQQMAVQSWDEYYIQWIWPKDFVIQSWKHKPLGNANHSATQTLLLKYEVVTTAYLQHEVVFVV